MSTVLFCTYVALEVNRHWSNSSKHSWNGAFFFSASFPARTWKQGDQIGRIFAHGAIANFGQLFENLKSIQILDYFGKSFYINFDKDWYN
jgi:hypothetical protein